MDAPNLPDISSFAAPVYVAFILIEILAIAKRRASGAYQAHDTMTSFMMGVGNVVSSIVIGAIVVTAGVSFLFWVYQYRLFDIPFAWWAFVLCFVLDDLRFYWSHRLRHRIRWGWASHVIHHSSQHYNLSTALRQPWFSFSTGFIILSVPLVLVGFHPAMMAFCISLNLFYQFFIHTEAVGRLPRIIEAVFNTPSHHRVHHAKNPEYLDANYAGVLIIWDRIFGTFVPENDETDIRYGLVTDLGTFNPIRVATHEYVAIAKDVRRPQLTMLQRLKYVFAPPGWSHDGSRRTTAQIKDAAARYAERQT